MPARRSGIAYAAARAHGPRIGRTAPGVATSLSGRRPVSASPHGPVVGRRCGQVDGTAYRVIRDVGVREGSCVTSRITSIRPGCNGASGSRRDPQRSDQHLCGSSRPQRRPQWPCQGEGRGFESRRPLHKVGGRRPFAEGLFSGPAKLRERSGKRNGPFRDRAFDCRAGPTRPSRMFGDLAERWSEASGSDSRPTTSSTRRSPLAQPCAPVVAGALSPPEATARGPCW